ncbi:MAG: glycine--tRNA ligase subunit beta [Coriobacteriia bacterium]|jgi:glycyl-tRNA synthetase beta chain|nr:glycine--tRNA ligase subunit beta [Coriobacteriia bacterium]
MKRELIFEIGAEEIPSTALYQAIGQLKADTEAALDAADLDYALVDVFGSPRRLVVRISDLADRQEDVSLRVKGPSAKAAFDEEGNPTKAAEGFARSKGVPVDALERVEEPAGAYVYAMVERPGRPALEVLPELLGKLVADIDWAKSMRWGTGEVRFVRPVRWLLALFGADVIPVSFGEVCAGRTTYGHRFLAPGPVEVPTASEYDLACKRGLVVYDHTLRAALVREGIEAAAAEAGAVPVMEEKVFAEVVNLVEWPVVGIGRFDSEFLEVPREILETAMESHQRYFPLQDVEGELMAAFVVVHNGDPARTESIISGHERVIRARLADGAFFYHEDLTRPLEAYVADLADITFQEKLGTLAQKVARIERLTARLAEITAAGPGDTAAAVRAAHLCKADLTTRAVIEFPSLQGVMGGYYARAAGEPQAVAVAIPEHYRPRFAEDEIPVTVPGQLVSVADKLDTITGIFAAGMAPTGSADPYALRRSALGVLAISIGGLGLTMDEAITASIDGYEGALEFGRQPLGLAVKTFISGRLEVLLRERGHAYDTVAAVLAVSSDDPADALARCEALTVFRAASDVMDDLSVAFTRAKNLAEPALGTDADVSIMAPEERALADALAEAEGRARESLGVRDYESALGVLAGLRGPIDAFFDSVLVMDADERLRANRLRLLNCFVGLFERFADFSRLAG